VSGTTAGQLEVPRGCGERILVVDGMEEQREIAASILASLGYTGAVAASGEEAVVQVRDQPADLIVLDMIMGEGMDGLDTYRRLVALKPGQKAIIASGYAETDRVLEARRIGAGAYLRKPYTLEAIARAVRRELDRDPDDGTPGL